MYLQRKLGWLDPPNVNVLLSQLVELSKSYDELKMFSEDTAIDAKKVHLIYDKRDHPKQSLFQQSLGDVQVSSLIVVFEGTMGSREEVCSLQLPPRKLKGNIQLWAGTS